MEWRTSVPISRVVNTRNGAFDARRRRLTRFFGAQPRAHALPPTSFGGSDRRNMRPLTFDPPVDEEEDDVDTEEHSLEPEARREKHAPNGFEDEEIRRQVAAQLRSMIDDYKASVQEKFDRFNLAEEVYNDETTMSSIDFLEDVDPYNMPLTSIRVDVAVGSVAGGFSSASPYFIVKGGDEGERGDVERDLHAALEYAGFPLAVRQAGYSAALKGRGPLRLTYQTIHEADRWVEDATGESDVAYSGLVIDPILPQDFVAYPAYVDDLAKARLIGHRFELRYAEIERRQREGIYFSEPNLEGVDDRSGVESSTQNDPDDYGVDLYDVIVRLRPKEGAPEKAYRATLAYTSQELLDIEEYPYPRPWYFAPGFRYDPNTFWPKHSIATRLLEVQAIYNDAWTIGVFGTVAKSMPTVLASNFLAEQQSTQIGIGRIVGFKGNPSFTQLRTDGSLEGVPGLIQGAERLADGISRVSQLGQGQALAGDRTATEAAAVQAGQAAGLSEYGDNFGMELARMARFALLLLGENFRAWKRFYGDEAQVAHPRVFFRRWRLEPNGKSPNNSPTAVNQKLQMLLTAAKALGLPMGPSQKTISPDGAMEVILNSLELPVSTDKVIHEQPPQPKPKPGPAGLTGGPLGDPANSLAQALAAAGGPNGLAGLLAGVAGGAPGPVPGGVPGLPPGLPPGVAPNVGPPVPMGGDLPMPGGA